MLSGVGPEAHLAEHKIPVVASMPGVGEHLMDHPVVDVALAETTGTSLNFLKPTTIWHHVQHITALLTYYFTGKGPLTSNVTCPCSMSSFFDFNSRIFVDRGSGCVLPFRRSSAFCARHIPFACSGGRNLWSKRSRSGVLRVACRIH